MPLHFRCVHEQWAAQWAVVVVCWSMFGFSGGQGDCGASNWCMVAHWPHWPHRQGSVVPHLHLQTPAPTHHMAQHT